LHMLQRKKERKKRKTKAPTLHDIDPLMYTQNVMCRGRNLTLGVTLLTYFESVSLEAPCRLIRNLQGAFKSRWKITLC
jgi:hypothetical protein